MATQILLTKQGLAMNKGEFAAGMVGDGCRVTADQLTLQLRPAPNMDARYFMTGSDQ